jgi:hypothetical protein
LIQVSDLLAMDFIQFKSLSYEESHAFYFKKFCNALSSQINKGIYYEDDVGSCLRSNVRMIYFKYNWNKNHVKYENCLKYKPPMIAYKDAGLCLPGCCSSYQRGTMGCLQHIIDMNIYLHPSEFCNTHKVVKIYNNKRIKKR